jgi:hypothetical protein
LELGVIDASRRHRLMGLPARLLLGLLALPSCSKTSGTAAPDGGEAGAPAGMTCQQIRMCVFGTPCADDACVQTCAARGSSEAKAAFEALRACTAKACATSDVNCACVEQCQGGGTCLHEADVCVGTATVDDICDSLCA